MQETIMCKLCKATKIGHGYWLKLWLSSYFNRCKCGAKQFILIKSEQDARKVMRRHNQTNELYHVPGEIAPTITGYQKDRNKLTKKDLEDFQRVSKSRTQKILESKMLK